MRSEFPKKSLLTGITSINQTFLVPILLVNFFFGFLFLLEMLSPTWKKIAFNTTSIYITNLQYFTY